jgi:hypothetical protein
MKRLTITQLLENAQKFAARESAINHPTMYGVTDGKTIGTYVETRLSEYLIEQGFLFDVGNHSKGIDFAESHLRTDIKVTSIRQPQSSCPFKSFREKVYGLDHNILLFVYDKTDMLRATKIDFVNCIFVDKARTADYQTTKGIHQILANDGTAEDLIAYFYDRNLPADQIGYQQLAEEILVNPPMQGYLTISNALQWRIQYQRVLSLGNDTAGIMRVI